MLTSQFVAGFLRARGVDRVFGTPGSDTVDLINAFAGEGIEYVLTHHENTAAYMAAAYGELRGIPGVVVVTKGPGVTNLASGIAAAHFDRRPIIVISATISPDILEKNPHQEVPLIALGRLIAKLSEEMPRDNAVELLPRAYRTAPTPRPGDVYVPISPRESTAKLTTPEAAERAVIERDIVSEPTDKSQNTTIILLSKDRKALGNIPSLLYSAHLTPTIDPKLPPHRRSPHR